MFHASIKHIGDKQYITYNLIFGNEKSKNAELEKEPLL